MDEILFHYAGLPSLRTESVWPVPAIHPPFPPLTAVCMPANPGWLSCTQPQHPCPDGCSVWPWGPAARGSTLEMEQFLSFLLTSEARGKASAEVRNRGWVPLGTPHESSCPLQKLSQGTTELPAVLGLESPNSELVPYFCFAVS